MKIGHARVLADASDMTEEDWKALRHKSIGSSDTAAVLGMGRYGSPLETWELKTGRRTFEQNFAMGLGHLMEPIILDLAADELSMTIEKPNLVLAHPDHPEMTCNLDGLGSNPYGEVAIIEAKHAGSYLKRQLETWDEMGAPDKGTAVEAWWVQIQQQLAVTGIEQGYLAALCDKRLFIIPVPRQPSFIDMMETLIPEWHKRHIEGGEQPEFTGNDAGAVERMFPSTDLEAEDVDMGPVAEAIEKAKQLKQSMRSLKEELAICEVQIKAQMGSAAAGFIGDEHVITCKDVVRNSIDTKKLKAEYPEVAEACSKTSTSRRYTY